MVTKASAWRALCVRCRSRDLPPPLPPVIPDSFVLTFPFVFPFIRLRRADPASSCRPYSAGGRGLRHAAYAALTFHDGCRFSSSWKTSKRPRPLSQPIRSRTSAALLNQKILHETPLRYTRGRTEKSKLLRALGVSAGGDDTITSTAWWTTSQYAFYFFFFFLNNYRRTLEAAAAM